MFGLKLKSWMEAHLGRPHRQKSTSSASGAHTGTSNGSQPPPPPTSCSSSSHQKRAGAPKDVSGSCSSSGSTTNSVSSSNGSTSTAIGIGAGSLLPGGTSSSTNSGNNNPTFCNFQPTSSSILAATTTSSSVAVFSAGTAAVGSESVTGSTSAQQQDVKIGKYGGGGGGGSPFPATSLQNGETIGTKDSEVDSRSHAPGESDPDHNSQHHQQHRTSPSIIPVSSSTGSGNSNNRASTVSTSVSNSTSILSGGSSFCNSLSSPDTGYSTDGYSPKSVYPALSFSTEGHTANKHSSASSSSTASKSSYTISSLVSSELLHSSGESKQTSASCSVQDGLDEHAPSPAAMLLTSSQSSSSGISDTGAVCFPKGLQHGHPSIPENDSTETSSSAQEKQVIMGVGEGDDKGERSGNNKKTIQLELEQKLLPSTGANSVKAAAVEPTTHSHSKFSPFSIDFLKRSSSSAGNGNNGNEENTKPSHGRTHRRAESMDARTPSHEDYKPLVDEHDEDDVTLGNPSSNFMTTTGSSSAAKSIRTSFVLTSSGQIVELSSYKNAYSICSPRRERTRIKTNPWITLSNNKKEGSSKSDSANKSTAKNANPGTAPASSSSGSDGETEKGKMSSSGGGGSSASGGEETGSKDAMVVPLEIRKEVEGCDKSRSGSKRVNLVEINKKNEEEQQQQREEETDNFMEDETGIVDHDSDDRSSSAQILYRISSASDSGKGSLVDPETNRNSTESSCLLSEDSTRNSIISQEVSGSSCCGRSSSGESISQHHQHHHHPLDNDEDDTVGHASSSCSPSTAAAAAAGTLETLPDQKEQQQGHSHQNKNSDQGQRTFRNASVATTDLLVKSASVSVGVGTTGSNKSANKQHPVMVDKETDILSDWATNTDVEDTEDDLETDREGDNNEDNETVTPAPSSPGTDVDRALFSQSSSGTTDIDFGDSSAATQASSTQVFPPSSLLRQHHHNSKNSSTYANTSSNGIRFHNGSNNNSQSESCGGESYDHHYLLQQQQQQQHQHQQQHNNINMNSNTAIGYPSVVPIVRPVLAAAQQQDTFSFDLVNHHPHTLQSQHHPFQPAMFYPSYPLEDDLLEDDYPQVKQSSGHKGIARGALGFLRKIFKKGACSSQRHSPDSLASSAAGRKNKGRGKSDNNLASVGMGSPLLTISEPLSNPRYSAAVLTSKKQINPALNGCYFLTPTPNSFRRRSGGIGGGQSDANTSGSDSKGSSNSKQQQPPKSVKTDIIRLPQGPLSPQQSIIQPHHQRATSSSHSSASSSSCSAMSMSNNPGIPQQCSTFLPHAAPVIASSFFSVGSAGPSAAVNNGNLIATISQQSNSASNTNNSSSTSSSIHSLMSTSTCSGNNRPPSQQQSKIPITQNLYANSSSASQNPITCSTNGRHSNNPFAMSNNGNNNNNSHHGVSARSPPPPPLISEKSPYLNGKEKSQSGRRDLAPPQQSLKGIIPPYESSPRLPASTARMNSPSFNNSYSPIHRLVVTGGSHLRNGNPSSNNPAAGMGHYPSGGGGSGESPLPVPRYNGSAVVIGTDNNSNNNFTAQFINRSHSHHPHPNTSMSQSPLINHRSSPHPQQQQYPPQIPSSVAAVSSSSFQQQQPSHNFFASPSPILRNPRYQYITSSNQNSPILNATKRLNGSTSIIMPCSSGNNGAGPNGPPPLLTTFTPLPSSSSTASCSQRESLINNNSNANTNTITISSGGSVNLNPSASSSSVVGGRQVVSTSLSYNEFENLSRQQANFPFHNNKNGNNGSSFGTFIPPAHHLQPQQQQLLHQNHHKSNKTLHLQQNHYYSSPIVKQRAAEQRQLEQSLWNNNEGASRGGGMRQYQNMHQQQQQQQQRPSNQNLRFNSFLVRHRQLPQFYHTQWGLQERIYETVDSEDERSSPGRGSDEMGGGGANCDMDLSIPMYNHQSQGRGGMIPRMKHSYSHKEGGFLCESNHVNGDECGMDEERPTKRSKPKTLSASGRPFPRPVVALPMMPAGTFLSETETRLLEADKESDRKYKRLINEAEALLKEISVEKEKRAVVAAIAGGGAHQRDHNSFREDCPQSDPLRRKAYDCWALRRLQQELAGCCASPPVLHRSRLNLQSPSTPTLANNPYLSHFQNMGMSMAPLPPMLPQQVPYISSGGVDDPNQNSFEF